MTVRPDRSRRNTRVVPMIPASNPVLFVIHQIGSQTNGGIESISELLAHSAALPRKIVITNAETEATERWRAVAEVHVWRMHEADLIAGSNRQRSKPRQAVRRLFNNGQVARLIRERNISLVHCNDHIAFGNAGFGARLAGAPIVFNVRDTLRDGSRRRALWRMYLRMSARFLVLSDEMVRSWRHELRPTSDSSAQAAKFAFVYSIVDRTKYSPVGQEQQAALRLALGVDVGRCAIVAVGRLEQKKGQLEFLRLALPALIRRCPEVVVHFVGDFEPERSPYAAACALEVARAGLGDHVRFHGHSTTPEDWYRVADVLILMSEREGLPRCMIEGIACGAPMVAFDVCSVREVLERHECGVAVARRNHAELADAVASLLEDPARADLYRRRGPTVASTLFDAERNGASFTAVLMAARSVGGTTRLPKRLYRALVSSTHNEG